MEMNGRFDHIEDVLIRLHRGQWFGWSDPKNKIYENLVIDDESKEKPTKKFLEDELKKQQDEFDVNKYQRDRATSYPSIQEQLDMQYWDAVNGTKKWQEAVAKVKTDNPKPE